jgi:hypothetical protein
VVYRAVCPFAVLAGRAWRAPLGVSRGRGVSPQWHLWVDSLPPEGAIGWKPSERDVAAMRLMSASGGPPTRTGAARAQHKGPLRKSRGSHQPASTGRVWPTVTSRSPIGVRQYPVPVYLIPRPRLTNTLPPFMQYPNPVYPIPWPRLSNTTMGSIALCSADYDLIMAVYVGLCRRSGKLERTLATKVLYDLTYLSYRASEQSGPPS